jgi:hypothetical protein
MHHTAPKDGQHPNKDLLTTLPNELLIHITELLPVREICRLRGLNRHLQSFIDTNEHLVVKDVIKYHRDRIHTEHRLLTDLSGCDTFDTLRRFYFHYGLRWLHMADQNPVLTKAVETYIPRPWVDAPDVLRTFFGLLEAEVKDHDIPCSNLAIMGTPTHHLLKEVEVKCVMRFDAFFYRAQQGLPDPILLDLLELGKKLLCTPPERYLFTADSPMHVLTKRVVGGEGRCRGIYNFERALFHTLLGLPVLDEDNRLAFVSRIKVRPRTSLLDRIASGPSPMLRQADFLQDILIW